MKILLVDDSKAVHAFTKTFFGEQHQILSAYHGKDALEQLAEHGDVECVLLDWEMPIMDGFETLQNIRKDGDTPIIMVTSKNDIDLIAKALEHGANEFVMKPFTKDILFEKISQVCEKEVA